MTTTAPAVAPARAPRLTFGGILSSEWIKFWSLRSSVWCCVIVLALAFGVSLLIAVVSNSPDTTSLPHDVQQAQVARDATAGLYVGELVVAVLGVLVISGEYGTGMIRSTFTAVPKRIPVFAGKAVVLAIVSFALGIVTTYGTALVISPFLARSGIHLDLADGDLNVALLGGSLYLALITLMSLGIGAMVRNSAGGIATALGVILVAPVILQLAAGFSNSAVLANVSNFLPTSAGARLYSYHALAAHSDSGFIQLDATQGGLVLAGWAVLALVVAGILMRRRDV
jgi:ABC-2 type transport system permease protein